MTLSDQVRARLADGIVPDPIDTEALREAERLAECFKDVKPHSFEIPMERFYGLPSFQSAQKTTEPAPNPNWSPDSQVLELV